MNFFNFIEISTQLITHPNRLNTILDLIECFLELLKKIQITFYKLFLELFQ